MESAGLPVGGPAVEGFGLREEMRSWQARSSVTLAELVGLLVRRLARTLERALAVWQGASQALRRPSGKLRLLAALALALAGQAELVQAGAGAAG